LGPLCVVLSSALYGFLPLPLTAITARISPFVVQVQSTQESGLSHPLHVSHVISQIFPQDILEIKKVGRSKVLVQTNTYEPANRLVSNNSLTSHNLRAFILTYKILRAGIIRDVPQDLSIELLKESISSSIKILKLHRLNRRMKINNEIRYVPSRTVCLKFADQSLSRFIYLFNCRYPVYPFIPKTRICFSCFKVGHLNKTCKSRPRCLYCGENSTRFLRGLCSKTISPYVHQLQRRPSGHISSVF